MQWMKPERARNQAKIDRARVVKGTNRDGDVGLFGSEELAGDAQAANEELLACGRAEDDVTIADKCRC